MEANGARIRRSIAALAVLAGMILVPAPASASGGGGCGQPVTDEAGTEVDIRDYCFSPTILRVAPGEEVTFVNRDRAPHSVLGANGAWGSYDLLKRGPAKGVMLRFTESGVFPYVCTYHIGMVGVVVVGDGVGGAIDTTTADGPVAQVPASELDVENAAVVTTPTQVDAEGIAWPTIVAAAFGSVLVAGGAIAVRRRRRSMV